MITAVLTIVGLIIRLLLERGASAPAREAQREYDDFKKALADGDTINASILIRSNLRRVFSSKGRNSTG